MKSISEPRLFALFRCQRFYRLQVEVVVKMQVIERFTMDQEVEHVVALTTDLKIKHRKSNKLKELQNYNFLKQNLAYLKSSFDPI